MSSRRFRRVVLGCLVVFLSLAIRPSAADEPDARKIYQQMVRGTAFVRGAKPGTGWLVDRERKLVVSSNQIVGAAKSVQVSFPEFKDDKLVADRDQYGKGIAGEVVGRDAKRDLVLIKLESIPDGVTALKLAAESPVPGERLHAIGNTAGSPGLWGYSTGYVRQVYRKKEAVGGAAFDARAITSQIPINAGDSGGPVVNAAGELVGVSCATVAGRLVTFAVDVSEVRDFLGSQKDVKKATIEKRPAPAEVAGADARNNPIPANYQKLLKGTVWISSETAKNAQASGCLVDGERKLVITAIRLVRGVDSAKVWFPQYDGDKLIGVRDHYRNKATPIIGKVVHREPRQGLALLELESLPKEAVAFKLAEQSAAPADDVYVLGNPGWATGLWVFSAGVARQTYLRKGGDWNSRALEAQTPHNAGDTGGPLLNSQGELVGMLDGTLDNTQFVTNCVDVTEIRSFLHSARDAERNAAKEAPKDADKKERGD